MEHDMTDPTGTLTPTTITRQTRLAAAGFLARYTEPTRGSCLL